MGDTIRCEDCGAAARVSDEGPERDKFCRFCGAAFRMPEPSSTVVVQESRADQRDRRFAELKAHSSTGRARRSKPSAAPAIVKHGGGLLILLIVLGFALTMGGLQCSAANEVQHSFQSFDRGVPPGFPNGFSPPGSGAPRGFFGLFKLIPVLVIGVIVFQIVRSGAKTASVASSPTRSWPACVVDEMTETRSSGKRHHTVTILTLERENGQRENFEVGSRLARKVARDDMGIAHSRGSELIGFTRVDV